MKAIHSYVIQFSIIFFTLFSLLISCKKKNNLPVSTGNPFPTKLFRSGNFHHGTYTTFKKFNGGTSQLDTSWTDTYIHPDTVNSVAFIDSYHVAFGGVKFSGAAGTDPIKFVEVPSSPAESGYMYYFVSRDSVAFSYQITVSPVPPDYTSENIESRYWTN